MAWAAGGANGLGRAGAEALARRGATVVVADLDEAGGQACAEQLSAHAAESVFVSTNVLSDESVEASFQEVERRFGRLDILVNSAGVVVQNATDRAFEKNLDMLLVGAWRGVRFGLPLMVKSGGGSIINVSSIAGITGSIGADGYGPSKHGVIGLTKDIALRHAGDNVRSNAVAPGYILTQMTRPFFSSEEESQQLINEKLRVPMRRWGRPEEIGSVIAFLASDESSFVTGTVIVADGGLTAR
ncbi:SDR family NAD(P)-dependent oxidoreductase [Nocardioides sp. NPDC051685]|uniref:SDR family NAD(P)-dependent oxidoreductase n=1 Tax=Nocardioides sp. NPDC051685 TaxID=3364334 RepID=UPI0037A472F6